MKQALLADASPNIAPQTLETPWSRNTSNVSEVELEIEEDPGMYSVFSHQNPVLHNHHAEKRRARTGSRAPSPVGSNFASPAPSIHGSFCVPGSGIDAVPPEMVTSVGHMKSTASGHVVAAQPRSTSAAAAHGTVFGLINFVVCVPTLISYAAIVFRVPSFQHDMPGLTKLFFLSSAVHQFVFTMGSSLPFAVGQVQDVGLIFLSQIATSVYIKATAAGSSYPETLATVLIACAGATTVTGALVWLVGKLKLSGYVQLLPLPVVGGYLGYIGYFCLAAGASLGTGLTVEGFGTWAQFFVWDPVLLSKLALSMAFAVFLFYVAYKIDHIAALPSVLVVTPVLFFVFLAVAGISLEDAREGGWVPRPASDPAAGWKCFRLYNDFEGIAWSVLPSQIPTVIGLVCVVSFGSVLDIAAIQTEQPYPLDFDGELKMIGVSNVASGALGGFTGSYIFSQTIFSQRQGVTSTLNGWIVGLGEFVLFLMPVDVLQFFPGFYIGGIMAFFGFDIMLDWLVHSRSKVSRPEYGLLLLTFLFVMFLGVIEGCAAGVAASAVVFIIVYSSTPAVEIHMGCSSTAMRSFDERAALLKLRQRIAHLELRGYLFFGAALQVSDKLLREVRELGSTWVVLDFMHVAGIDSTSARALSKLVVALKTESVCIAFCISDGKLQMKQLLEENGAFPLEEDFSRGRSVITDNLDEALAWCERGALREANVPPPGTPAGPLVLAQTPGPHPPRTDLKTNEAARLKRLTVLLREFVAPLPGSMRRIDAEAMETETRSLETLAAKLEDRSFEPGEALFVAGADCQDFMLVVEGTAVSDSAADNTAGLPSWAAAGKFTFEPGSLLGEVDFHLGGQRSYTARAGPQGCRVAAMTRKTAEKLEAEDPRLALLAQRLALRSVCLLTEATVGLYVRGCTASTPAAGNAPTV